MKVTDIQRKIKDVPYNLNTILEDLKENAGSGGDIPPSTNIDDNIISNETTWSSDKINTLTIMSDGSSVIANILELKTDINGVRVDLINYNNKIIDAVL